jgi:hypothetical protein
VSVLRLEELLRLRGVNERRHIEPREFIPERVDVGIVDLQSRAIRLGDAQSKLLAHLAHAQRAGLDVGAQLGNRLVRPARANIAEVDARERAEAILVGRRIDRRDGLDQAIAADVVGERQDPQVQRIHGLNEALHRVLGELSLVAVNVDDRELRFRHFVLDGDKRAFRAVVDDAGRRRRWRLAAARTRLGGAWRAFLPGGDACPAAALRREPGADNSAHQHDYNNPRKSHDTILFVLGRFYVRATYVLRAFYVRNLSIVERL